MTITELINNYSFVVKWCAEDNVFISYAQEIPSVKAHGDSEESSIRAVKNALSISLEWMQEDGENIPEPKPLVA